MIPGRILYRPMARQGYGLHSLATASIARPRLPLFPGHDRRPARKWESTIATPDTGHSADTGASTITTDKESGHIAAASNEHILYFDNLFPLRISPIMFWRPWETNHDFSELLKKFENSSLGMLDPINLVKRAIPEKVPLKVTQIIPRLKDGGAYVKFTHSGDISASEIEATLADILQKNPIRPWFNPFRGIKAGLVQGRPWLEDLYRFPKGRLRVEFVPSADTEPAAELSQETLYSIFRRYGKIGDITSQPSDSKVLPKYAYVDFASVRDAVMARNCMHGFVLREEGSKSATKLRLSYEQRVKPHRIWDWITSHPRIIIPLVAAFLAAFTVAVFDPIREFFVKIHVQRTFEFTNSRLYKWFKRQTDDILAFRKRKSEHEGLNALFTHRKDLIDSIQAGLLESVDTFVVVHGPRGSGKRELVLDQVLHGRRDVLILDCKPVVEARGEAGLIRQLAGQVGYRPVFSWANNLSNLVDLAIQSTTGVKAGFSENLESQLVKILQTSASALKKVSLAGRKKNDPDANLSEDAYLEAHPEQRPVIVIDNFLYKNDDAGIIYDKISDWAAALVQSNIAHVIFLTNDTSYSKSLSKSLPDRVFHQVTLGDLSPNVAKQFVISQLETQERADKSEDDEQENNRPKPITEKQRREDLKELDECIDALGGRLTDLQVLARRLKIGQTPKKAVSEIIEQSASEILRMFLLTNKRALDADKKWSTEQAWFLIKEIAEKGSLRYNEVLLSNTFASSTTAGATNAESAIESLAEAELITVKSEHGRPTIIRAGKPVYRAAFSRLLQDAVVKSRMNLALLTELAKIEAKNIDKAETELSVLAQLPTQPYQTVERVNYLLDKVYGSQRKIAAFEKEMGSLKKVLSEVD
ncbi:RNA12 protein-domain-containing protein [Podospora didyma]|uniref:Mitochondrial escape protein 2 n=1 Tax=Podospora didyma TaxID=330526 RepID=A0AAE0U1C9_9PEZI|nr:RNA12 protein-domain-containing protein [Podospora didyma]